ncbi:GtrA family protein [Aquibacillus rhizosphaerae]|uniref:GtrA family protein n=1 Tax=Aquibacillus rhizosphaerae TaxID=3051431 RepID=A0ABT7L5E2_9BACI|nr:GtrA family protein [Aquibacillus sp. LR5S19]MDL4839796.1 GtrA family protein [Aquibacillus sp. LR5S19]
MTYKRYKKSIMEYLSYSIIGIICAALDIGVLNGLLYFFPTEQTSLLTLYNSLAYTVAILNSYIWNTRYTFKVTKSKKLFFAFIFQAIISLFIANIVFLSGLWLFQFISIFPGLVETNIAKGLSMYLSSLSSFFFIKFIVSYKKKVWEKDKS